LRFKKKLKAALDTAAYETTKTIVLNNIKKKSFIIFAEENPAALSRSHDSASMIVQFLFLKILYAKQWS
jgi:hypothetical protein